MAGGNSDQTFQDGSFNRFSPTDLTSRDNPHIPLICDTEEIYPKPTLEEQNEEQDQAFNGHLIPFLSVRCVVTFICLVGTILVIVATARSRLQRYKSWRLYLLTSLMILSWVFLSLYQGKCKLIAQFKIY